MVRTLVVVLISLLGILPVQNGNAAFPERSIRLIVAFPPGGSIDVVARILAEKLRVSMGCGQYRCAIGRECGPRRLHGVDDDVGDRDQSVDVADQP